MSFMKTFFAAACLAALSAGQADTLLLDDLEARGSSAPRPTRGMSMDRVEARFGTPVNRMAAVGEPPISRWEYPDFTVYFEYQFVIHAVQKR